MSLILGLSRFVNSQKLGVANSHFTGLGGWQLSLKKNIFLGGLRTTHWGCLGSFVGINVSIHYYL